MSIIGFAGKMGVGKDTAADVYIEALMSGAYEDSHKRVNSFTKMAFADELKEDIESFFGLRRRVLNDQTLKNQKIPEFDKTPREIMQAYGAFMRSIKPDYWVYRLRNRVLEFTFRYHGPFLIFLSDVRYPDEADMIRELGGAVVLIEGPQRIEVVGGGHESERALEGYTGFLTTIDNSGTEADLLEQVAIIVDCIRR